MKISEYLNLVGVFILEVLKWSIISLLEIFINLCTILAGLVWVLYILNFLIYILTELFNYYIPTHTKTCYKIFDVEYCTNNP